MQKSIKQLGNVFAGANRDNPNPGRVYDEEGLCPTLGTMQGGNREPMIIETEQVRESVCVGGFGEKTSNNGTQYYQQDRVYEMGDVSLTLPAQLPGGSYNYIDAKCVAMRGRNPENPSDRRKGIDLEQTLEINNNGIANTITTVQKDNMVLIRQATKEGAIPCKVGGVADLNYPDSQTRRGRVQGNGEICPTLTTENIPSVLEDWTWEIDGVTYLIRIRKLTPKECWRLMGFSDEDFHKAEKVCSNSQLYKQAGNSIVTPVLEAIFKNLF